MSSTTNNQKEKERETLGFATTWNPMFLIPESWKAKVDILDFTKILLRYQHHASEHRLMVCGSNHPCTPQEWVDTIIVPYQKAMRSDKSISLVSSIELLRKYQATLFDFSIDDKTHLPMSKGMVRYHKQTKTCDILKNPKPSLVADPIDLLRGLLLYTIPMLALAKRRETFADENFGTAEEMAATITKLEREVYMMKQWLKIDTIYPFHEDDYDGDDKQDKETLSACRKADPTCSIKVCPKCSFCELHSPSNCNQCCEPTKDEVEMTGEKIVSQPPPPPPSPPAKSALEELSDEMEIDTDEKKKKEDAPPASFSSSSSVSAAVAVASTAAAAASAPIVPDSPKTADKKAEGICIVPKCNKGAMDGSVCCTTHNNHKRRCGTCHEFINKDCDHCEYCEVCCQCCKRCGLPESECHLKRANGTLNGCRAKDKGKLCKKEAVCCEHKRCKKHALADCKRRHPDCFAAVKHGNSDNTDNDDDDE